MLLPLSLLSYTSTLEKLYLFPVAADVASCVASQSGKKEKDRNIEKYRQTEHKILLLR